MLLLALDILDVSPSASLLRFVKDNLLTICITRYPFLALKNAQQQQPAYRDGHEDFWSLVIRQTAIGAGANLSGEMIQVYGLYDTARRGNSLTTIPILPCTECCGTIYLFSLFMFPYFAATSTVRRSLRREQTYGQYCSPPIEEIQFKRRVCVIQ